MFIRNVPNTYNKNIEYHPKEYIKELVKLGKSLCESVYSKYSENLIPGGSHSLVANSEDILVDIFDQINFLKKNSDKVWEIGMGYPAVSFILSLLTGSEVIGTDIGETFKQLILIAKEYTKSRHNSKSKIFKSKTTKSDNEGTISKTNEEPNPNPNLNTALNKRIGKKIIVFSSDEEDQKTKTLKSTIIDSTTTTLDKSKPFVLFNAYLNISVLDKLNPKTWLNDEIINASLLLTLYEEHSNLIDKVKVFNTFFYNKLIRYSTDFPKNFYPWNEIFYADVSKWGSKMYPSIFNSEIAIIPINITNTHWNMCILLHPDKLSMLIEKQSPSNENNEFCILLLDSSLKFSKSRYRDAFHPDGIIDNILSYIFEVQILYIFLIIII